MRRNFVKTALSKAGGPFLIFCGIVTIFNTK